MNSLVFKIATEADELRQIRALNYRTFVEEIPQHSPNPGRSLVDRFEQESIFCICLCGDKVIAMVAIRSNRPFSLDIKLPCLDAYLPPHNSACEIRLLAIESKYRKGRILTGLIGMVFDLFEIRGHDLALISGTLRQARLYAHMGFQAFGPVVGSPDAQYQPMYQFVNHFRARAKELRSKALGTQTRLSVSLLPGPVCLAPAVRAALGAKPVSHRAEAFTQILERTRHMLCELTGARAVVIATGSGTLANDMVAGQLAQLSGRGLILCNGEFGQRLVDHASRFNLDFEVVETPWGASFAEDSIRQTLARNPAKSWLWAVHAETSTGVLNDLDMLKRLAREWGLTLCIDCVSSLGVVPCDLRGVAFASGVSGKGLQSMAGLALVFNDMELPPPTRTLPRYIDLRLYLAPGIPFTMPSGLLTALSLALETLDPDTRYPAVRESSDWLCHELQRAGLTPLAAAAARFPGAITIPLPQNVSSRTLGSALAHKGWLLSYQSSYLIERNWIQVCLLGHTEHADLQPLPGLLASAISARH
ncbi:MAG: aminotransferase class V-fold PLP-dependent enzyme [Kiritimatiellae bacterium]|nr:aminotransferase class V-fold PLP-dependent enzyme [Kiritimatiellia bacterium]